MGTEVHQCLFVQDKHILQPGGAGEKNLMLPHERPVEPLDKVMAGRKILSMNLAYDTLLIIQNLLYCSHNLSRVGQGEEIYNPTEIDVFLSSVWHR